MKNFEKYKTVEERAKAFYKYCIEKDRTCKTCQKLECMKCEFEWLDLEAEEEKPLPCPFCGEPTKVVDNEELGVGVECTDCSYASANYDTAELAIAAHNRVAKAVMDAKAKEANDEAAK